MVVFFFFFHFFHSVKICNKPTKKRIYQQKLCSQKMSTDDVTKCTSKCYTGTIYVTVQLLNLSLSKTKLLNYTDLIFIFCSLSLDIIRGFSRNVINYVISVECVVKNNMFLIWMAILRLGLTY